MGLFSDGFKELKKASEPLYKAPKSMQECRVKMGMKQEKLAEALITKKSTISAYENDKIDIKVINRLEKIIYEAENRNVQIAFENLGNLQNLALVLNKFPTKNVGYCYDSCHHINYASNEDLLELYGNRLMALHLHDNGGKHNQHQLPFDGNINWTEVMNKIASTNYHGSTTLEPMHWDYEHLPKCGSFSQLFNRFQLGQLFPNFSVIHTILPSPWYSSK